MAQREVQLDNETFCSICLDLLKDPVTIPCGHSYCMSCIKTHWDEEDERKIHGCPQCRPTFTLRPGLVEDTTLADLVEQLKKTGLQAAPAGPEDVVCDVCTVDKLKALKFCLVCLVSYCEKHLQPHFESPAFKKHKLVEPSKKFHICSHHDKVMKMFCRTDQQTICYLCSVDEHKGHDTVSAAAERTERQRELEVSRQNLQQRIQDREKDVKVLQQEVEAINRSADKAMKNAKRNFAQLTCLINKIKADVRKQVTSRQRTEVSRVKERQKKLRREIAELMKKDAELKKLSRTEDQNQFLHKYLSLSPLSEPADSSSIDICYRGNFEDVTAAVSLFRGELEDFVSDTWKHVSQSVIDVDLSLSNSRPEPKTRAGFLKYSRDITLDPNTAHTQLSLSGRKSEAALMSRQQGYSGHPDRFTDCWEVLSTESLTGRCYWEVTWKGSVVYMAVAYKNISRAGSGNECRFGFNNKSWALRCHNKSYEFWHNNTKTPVSGPWTCRVGVYLDQSAGLLSFFSVSDDYMTLLHRVQTTFTQPLHAGLWILNWGDAAEFCKLKLKL